ncbi:hypothetical protein HN020_21665 [Brevibacillus borstelensis]|uniref:hypothetical protein n=1 Tax=Brevibacillus borstelensis TaxID=45462 RepID=UPI0014906BC2|nr:hypothetical protein [Brevibacillus borstelensis]NOU57303.1 hypothetical protein [Brevibacillus borstelensis]
MYCAISLERTCEFGKTPKYATYASSVADAFTQAQRDAQTFTEFAVAKCITKHSITEPVSDHAVAKYAIAKRAITESIAEYAIAKYAVSGGAKTKQALSDDAIAKHAVTEHAKTKQALSDDAIAKHAVTEHAKTKQAASDDAIAEHAVSEYAITEHAITKQTLPEKTVKPQTASSAEEKGTQTKVRGSCRPRNAPVQVQNAYGAYASLQAKM